MAYIRAPLPFLLAAGRDYGPVTYLRFGGWPVYMLNEPDLVEQMLIGHHRDCIKDKYTRDLIPIAGHGLLTSEGELWQRQRKLAAPPLQPKRISNYAAAMLSAAQQSCAEIRDGEVRDVRADLTAITLAIVGRTLLGTDTRGEAEAIRHAVEAFTTFYERQIYSLQGFLPPSVPTLARWRMRKAIARLDTAVMALIARSRVQGATEDHVLSRLLRARDEHGQAMSERQLRDEVVTMLLAGHETSALTLTFALYLLAGHPEVVVRLRSELEAAPHEAVSNGAVRAERPYLNAVVRETMRLYPPAYTLTREVVTGFEIGGYRIEPGSQVMLSPYVLHRDPRWFTQPERFAPERWLEPAIQALPKFAYLPFGAGPRVCIGNHFAMLEIAIVLAEFVRRFEFERLPSFRLELAPLVTLRPAGPVPLRFHRRQLS